jgi:transcriptional regulator GlxA family with amidase domain
MKSDKEFVDSLLRIVKQNYTNPNFNVGSMAGEMEISDRQLQRKVKVLTGRSPMQYLRGFRLERSLPYLRECVPVGETAKIVGFSSHTYFSSCFKSHFGITPLQLQHHWARVTKTDLRAGDRGHPLQLN